MARKKRTPRSSTKSHAKKQQNKSPYTAFVDWLYNPVPTVDLPDWVMRAINPRSVLCMFGGHGRLTIWLNSVFNTYDLMRMDPKEFYQFLKKIIKRYRINRKTLTFFKSEQLDRSLNDIRSSHLPHLKPYEISMLLDMIDPELDGGFLESLGLKKYKMEKMKKRRRGRPKKQTNEQVETVPPPSSHGSLSFDQWRTMLEKNRANPSAFNIN